MYRHTQKSPLCLLVYAIGVAILGLAGLVVREPIAQAVMAGSGLVILVLAASFHHLHVEDEGDEVGIRFGPLPLFSKTIRYADMTNARVGRTTLMEGWGIHKSFREGGGWVWNLWGFDCVVIEHHGRTLVGSDDAENLAQFLNRRIEASNSTTD